MYTIEWFKWQYLWWRGRGVGRQSNDNMQRRGHSWHNQASLCALCTLSFLVGLKQWEHFKILVVSYIFWNCRFNLLYFQTRFRIQSLCFFSVAKAAAGDDWQNWFFIFSSDCSPPNPAYGRWPGKELRDTNNVWINDQSLYKKSQKNCSDAFSVCLLLRCHHDNINKKNEGSQRAMFFLCWLLMGIS